MNKQLMTEAEVVELMRGSSSLVEWRANAATVRLLHGGELPAFWVPAIYGSGLAHRKEAEWTLGRVQPAEPAPFDKPQADEQQRMTASIFARLEELLERPGHRPPQIERIIVMPKGDPLASATAALAALRRTMQTIDVPPVVWLTALGCELATMFGAQFPNKPREEWEQLLGDLLHGVQGDSRTQRAASRRRLKLPAD